MLDWLVTTKTNTWEPEELDMERVLNAKSHIYHRKRQDVCIIFEKEKYLEIVIYNDTIESSFGRYIIAEDYYWNAKEEHKFNLLLKEGNTVCNIEHLWDLYKRYSQKYPEWHLKFYDHDPMRMFDHIRHCLQKDGLKEILYKAGLDEFSVSLEGIEGYNLIGTTPTDIFDGLSMRVLRAIHCPSGIELINSESNRKKLLQLQKRYAWMFENKWNKFTCMYMHKLFDEEKDCEKIAQRFRKYYQKLQDIWTIYQYDSFLELLDNNEEIEKILGKKYFSKMNLKDLHNIYEILILNREWWNEAIHNSNLKRNMFYEYADELYTIFYPRRIEEFVCEALSQQNCLLNYLDSYSENCTNIMFLRKKDDRKESYVTVEMDQNCLLQAYERFNVEPNRQTLEWLKQYAKLKGLEYAIDYSEEE